MSSCHLLIPAAGSGQRFGGPIAKQYADLCGAPVIERTLQSLLGLVDFDSVSVGLAAGDEGWDSAYDWLRVTGGESRSETVLNLLESLADTAKDDDWVWVQDAVRPFMSAAVARRLGEAMSQKGECFVVALPAVDTLKEVDTDNFVTRTVDRSVIWTAQTPQVCRYATLKGALQLSIEQGKEITDEASAMEFLGTPVKLVMGSEDNIKITRPGDIRLAEFIYTKRLSE